MSQSKLASEEKMASDSSVSEKSEDEQDGNHNANSLLSILDDKNKMIASLRDQLHNQKLQLKYYLQDKIGGEDVKKLSKTCLTSAVDDNIAVNLEVANFCRKSGKTSKLRSTYDSMCQIQNKIQCLLKLQEKVIRIVVGKILNTKGETLEKFSLDPLKKHPGQYSLFYSMFQVNGQLFKELCSFKLCCNRLIAIEDERNALAEEICSLPSDKKSKCRSLMLLSDEKLKLEQEIKQLHLERQRLIVAKRPESPEGRNTSLKNLNKMLEAVNAEAATLLKTSLHQKHTYQIDLQKLQQENCTLKTKLRNLAAIVKSKEEVDVKFKKLEGLCMQSIQDNLVIHRKQQKKWRRDVRLLKKKLEMVVAEKDALKRRFLKANPNGQAEINPDENFTKEVDKLREERDDYKKKYESLCYIQDSYDKLVEQNVLLKEIETAKTNKICDMKESYKNLLVKLQEQSNNAAFLHKHIKSLLIAIYILRKNEMKALSKVVEGGGNLEEDVGGRRGEEGLKYPDSDCESLVNRITKANLWINDSTFPKKNVTKVNYARVSSDVRYLNIENEDSFCCLVESSEALPTVFPLNNKYKAARSAPAIEKIQKILSQYEDVVQTTREVKSEPKNFETNSTTSSNSDRSEVASLTRSKVASIMATKHFNSKTNTSVASANDYCLKNKIILRESELMKDCSNESLVSFYQAMNKKVVGTQVSKESTLRLAETKCKQTSTTEVVSVTTNAQTFNNCVDRTTSSLIKSIDQTTSNERNCGTDTEIPSTVYLENVTETSLMKTESSFGTDVEYITLGKEDLPGPSTFDRKTPLQCLLEEPNFPKHILHLSNSELLGKLENISSQLDATLLGIQTNDVSVVNTVRTIFDTLFGSRSVYAK